MAQIITDNLEFNVTHEINVPETGVITASSDGVSPMGFLAIGLGLAMLMLGITFLISYKKSKHKLSNNSGNFHLKKKLRNRQRILGGLFGISVCAFGLSVSGLVMAASTAITTKLPVTATSTGTTAKADVSLTLDADYANGYSVYAVFHGDGKLYNVDKTASIAMTDTVATDSVAVNSFGVSFLKDDGTIEKYGAIATTEGAATMTKLFSTTQAAASGTVVNLSYLANLNIETAIGDYTGEIEYHVIVNESACNPAATSIENAVCMQDINTAVKNSMITGTKYTLKDSRDDESYAVAKLADGKVWLLDNLRLDLANSSVQTNLTSSTTNASDATLNYLKNGGGTSSDQYASAAVAYWVNHPDWSYSTPLINIASKDVVPAGAPSPSSGSNKIGVYYNYCAASAGSYCYGDGISHGSPSGNATEDICPAGWRMPTGDSSGEYQTLYAAYGSDASSFRSALSTPLSGVIFTGTAVDQGVYGYAWSSVYYDSNNMYSLSVAPSSILPASGGGRSRGLPMRCIAQ